MKIHTTNYTNTFILVADDCPVESAEVPPQKGESRSVATIQFDKVAQNPYRYTSDEVLFSVYAEKQDLTSEELDAAREQFFSKGQPCFRASPLTKRYGWGVHYDDQGKMAIYPVGSDEYQKWSQAPGVKVLKAMKSAR